MKILEINKFNYQRRGAERHFLDVIELLKSNNNEVAVFSMSHPENAMSEWDKYFISYAGFSQNDSWVAKLRGLSRIYSFEAKRKIGSLLDDFQPDVVHIHNIYHHISPSILSEIKKRKIPIIMTVHDYNLVCPDYSLLCKEKRWDEIPGNRFWFFLKNKCFKNSYIKSFLAIFEFKLNKVIGFYEKYVDKFIVPSQFVKDIFVKEGIDEKKIEVLPHFISTEYVEKKQTASIEKPYAFYAGSISKEKGVDKLVDLFANFPDLDLYLAGKIEDGFGFEKKENVKYLGFLKQDKMDVYVENSLFVISLSSLPETFGLVALESIAHGKPFVGFDAGAFKEIVSNGENGFICANINEIQDRVGSIIRKDICFDKEKIALDARVKFGKEKYYQNLMKIFNELL